MPSMRIAFALAGIFALIAGAVGTAATAQPGPPATRVVVGKAQSQSLAPRQGVSGVIRARRISELAAREPGLVLEFELERGTRVRKGDVVARLDPAIAELALDARRADAARVEALIERRQAELEDAEMELGRSEQLVAEGVPTEREVEDARIGLRVAQAQLAEAEAELDQARAMLAEAERRLEDLTVRAPFDAVVIETHTEVGAWVAAGGGVATVIEADRYELVLDVPEMLLAVAMRAGIDARIPGVGESVRAEPIAAVPQSDESSGLVPVRYEVEAQTADGTPIVPGMRAIGQIAAGEPSATMTVPKDAINRGPTGEFVFVAAPGQGGGHTAAMVSVRVLFAAGPERVAVAAPGLEDGALVIVQGNERLMQPNSPVAFEPPAEGGAESGGEG